VKNQVDQDLFRIGGAEDPLLIGKKGWSHCWSRESRDTGGRKGGEYYPEGKVMRKAEMKKIQGTRGKFQKRHSGKKKRARLGQSGDLMSLYDREGGKRQNTQWTTGEAQVSKYTKETPSSLARDKGERLGDGQGHGADS